VRVQFVDFVRTLAARRGVHLPPASHPEPLAHLEYAEEWRLKNEAIRAFWKHHGLAGDLREVIAAPRPRGYRWTSKRRALPRRGGLALAFSGDAGARPGVAASQLDPSEHLAVYAHLIRQLDRPACAVLTAQLNHVIARGYAGGLCVILNLRAFDAGIVRRAKQIGESLQAADLGVRSAFLYLDPTGSDYYLEARRPTRVLSWKSLFGPDWLEVAVDDRRLRFPPVVFSQVNGAMLPVLTATARELLRPLAGRLLLDLYCGYGLFSLCLGNETAQGLGIDAEGPAIDAARENARRAGLAAKTRFLAGRITAELLASGARSRRPEVALLDPPRQGTERGVIDALARRGPEHALHVFCGTDEIPRELEAWRRAGYRVESAVPLDLFPGSAALETMALLRPDERRGSAPRRFADGHRARG
jgi:tRNA/tmRNA/rRNA uracil-C5-methylase (TrmA/RlmC/RlmD family)